MDVAAAAMVAFADETFGEFCGSRPPRTSGVSRLSAVDFPQGWDPARTLEGRSASESSTNRGESIGRLDCEPDSE